MGGSDCKIDRLDYHKNYHFVTQNSLLDCILATIQLQYEYRKNIMMNMIMILFLVIILLLIFMQNYAMMNRLGRY